MTEREQQKREIAQRLRELVEEIDEVTNNLWEYRQEIDRLITAYFAI